MQRMMIKMDKNDLSYRLELELREVVSKLKQGETPIDIARTWPEIFLLRGSEIILLYEHLNRTQWRWKK